MYRIISYKASLTINYFPGPGIGSIITPDALSKLFSEMTQEEKDEIKQHLPANQQSDEGIRENLLSPQLKQAMQSLS